MEIFRTFGSEQNSKKQKMWVKSPQSIKLLAWRVCKKRSSNYINSLKNSSGVLKTNPEHIVHILAQFYEQLYSSTNP